MRDQAGVHRRPTRLEDEHVRPLFRDELSAALRLTEERDLVRHRRRREKERFLLAEEIRGPPLELVHRGVLAKLLVTDIRLDHRRAHRGSGFRGRVRTEIDHRAILAAGWT
jgi:hypothetical protein